METESTVVSGKEYTFDEIANALGVSTTQAHNKAKRAFNKVIAGMMSANQGMTIVDVVLDLMNMWDIDPYAIKTMLNQENKALLYKELADDYRLLSRGVIEQSKYKKWTDVLEKKGKK